MRKLRTKTATDTKPAEPPNFGSETEKNDS